MNKTNFIKLIDWISIINENVSYDEMLFELELHGILFSERHMFNNKYVVIDKNSYSRCIDLLDGSSSYRITRLDLKFDYDMKFEDIVSLYGTDWDFTSCVGDRDSIKTIYFGSRNSDLFCRFYNKTAESNLDFDLSRLEYEIKGQVARLFSARLSYIGFDDAYNYIMQILTEFSSKHNLISFFNVFDFSSPVDFSIIDNKISKEKFIYFVRHNASSFLTWLDKFDITPEEFKSLCHLSKAELCEVVYNEY